MSKCISSLLSFVLSRTSFFSKFMHQNLFLAPEFVKLGYDHENINVYTTKSISDGLIMFDSSGLHGARHLKNTESISA